MNTPTPGPVTACSDYSSRLQMALQMADWSAVSRLAEEAA